MIINCGPFANVEMEATVKQFHARNWLYLQFKQGRACIDLATGEIVKGQSHKSPLIVKEEVARIVSLFK